MMVFSQYPLSFFPIVMGEFFQWVCTTHPTNFAHAQDDTRVNKNEKRSQNAGRHAGMKIGELLVNAGCLEQYRF